MAKEPENLILIHLREIRAEIAGIRTEISAVKTEQVQRFDNIDKALETLKFQMTYTYGAEGLAGVNSMGADAKADAALKRLDAHEAEMADVKRRLQALEDA